MAHVMKFGPRHWCLASKEIGGRNAAQCRKRWRFSLDPQLKRGAWSAEEVVAIYI
jgi:hypothetical protein